MGVLTSQRVYIDPDGVKVGVDDSLLLSLFVIDILFLTSSKRLFETEEADPGPVKKQNLSNKPFDECFVHF